MSWLCRRSRFKYVTNDYELNRALCSLDNELAELKSRSEEHITYHEFEQLEKRVSQIEDRLELLIVRFNELLDFLRLKLPASRNEALNRSDDGFLVCLKIEEEVSEG